MVSEFEVIRILLEISDKTYDELLSAIREKIEEMVNRAEENRENMYKQQKAEQNARKAEQNARKAERADEKAPTPEDEPQKLLRSKEVIGKTNRGGGEEYIRHREADGAAFGGMVHKRDRGRDGMHRSDD